METEIIKIALIPAYQPDEGLIKLTDELMRSGFACVVVDDGSGTKYSSLFGKMQTDVQFISYEKNMGKGYVLKTGYRYILSHYPATAIVVTVDADGQHMLSDILRVCGASAENPEALVLGCRKFEGEVPLRSRFGNRVTSLVFGAAVHEAIEDTQTGLRAFRAGLCTPMLKIEGDRYEYEMNVLLYFAKKSRKLYRFRLQRFMIREILPHIFIRSGTRPLFIRKS